MAEITNYHPYQSINIITIVNQVNQSS